MTKEKPTETQNNKTDSTIKVFGKDTQSLINDQSKSKAEGITCSELPEKIKLSKLLDDNEAIISVTINKQSEPTA